MTPANAPGTEWSNHYRGYRLQTNPDGDVWWQPYQGTDRLFLEPTPEEIVDSLLDLKRLGGRVRITEGNDVITRVEEGDEYETVWVGEVTLTGKLVPADDPEYNIPLNPSNVEPEEFWPSVYDGAKYSFGPGADRVWWSNPDTHKRHPVRTSLPTDIVSTLSRIKPRGGSFRVTPWNDILTLVDSDKLSTDAQSQFDELPRVVKNLISLRREMGGVEKLPVYVGQVEKTPFTIDDPPSLTDPVSSGDLGIDEWTESLGETVPTESSDHTVSGQSEDSQTEADEVDIPDDDPMDW
jgi:hypothetical protein